MISDRRTFSTTVSNRIIDYLACKGYDQWEIAKLLHVREGFITLVKKRERGLMIDHADLAASALSMQLGEFMIMVTKPKRLTKKNRELFKLTTRIMRLADKTRAAILRDAGGKRSRRSA